MMHGEQVDRASIAEMREQTMNAHSGELFARASALRTLSPGQRQSAGNEHVEELREERRLRDSQRRVSLRERETATTSPTTTSTTRTPARAEAPEREAGLDAGGDADWFRREMVVPPMAAHTVARQLAADDDCSDSSSENATSKPRAAPRASSAFRPHPHQVVDESRFYRARAVGILRNPELAYLHEPPTPTVAGKALPRRVNGEEVRTPNSAMVEHIIAHTLRQADVRTSQQIAGEIDEQRGGGDTVRSRLVLGADEEWLKKSTMEVLEAKARYFEAECLKQPNLCLGGMHVTYDESSGEKKTPHWMQRAAAAGATTDAKDMIAEYASAASQMHGI